MIKRHIHHSILQIELVENLSEEDFKELTQVVDTYLATHEKLRGILIHTEHFPIWKNFQALMSHFTFVKDHHKSINKIFCRPIRVASIHVFFHYRK